MNLSLSDLSIARDWLIKWDNEGTGCDDGDGDEDDEDDESDEFMFRFAVELTRYYQ